MLEKCDLSAATDEKTLVKELPPLQERLGVLQRELHDAHVPVMIVIEGWNVSGITMSTQEIIRSLDPRGFSLHATRTPTAEEIARPFMWRFWTRTAERGRIAIFARSWYSRAITEEMDRSGWKKSFKDRVVPITTFERQLADDGMAIVKIFLHIGKEEQKRRLVERELNPLTAWQVTPRLWTIHSHYDENLPEIDELLEKTDTEKNPWFVIPATDPGYALLKIHSVLVKRLEEFAAAATDGRRGKNRSGDIVVPKKAKVRRESSPPHSFGKEECRQTLENLQFEMLELHPLLYKRKIPLIIVYEGRDAAGKGGNIMRITRFMNPLGYNVATTAKPNDYEKEHHYLWRFWNRFPKAGHIAIFDRSWYGRVLVERVENFCTETEWKRAYNEINEMEGEYVDAGGGLVKFWLEISKKEQLERFRQRVADPLKTWKITDEDWRNRKKWDLYTEAIDEMLARTDTGRAPWTVVESDNKWYARVKTMKTLVEYGHKLL
jgi:polyphosphate:AMP phosphotransferase